jgi:hypothetical protein
VRLRFLLAGGGDRSTSSSKSGTVSSSLSDIVKMKSSSNFRFVEGAILFGFGRWCAGAYSNTDIT